MKSLPSFVDGVKGLYQVLKHVNHALKLWTEQNL